MILLFDLYDNDSFMLHASVLAAGIPCRAVSVLDDGFLPEDVHSPYMEIIGQRGDDAPHPLYFDRLKVPRFWEIRGTGSEGEVWDETRLRGKIVYAEPRYKRYVSRVEWLDQEGKIILKEHYNQWGRMFAKSFTDAAGKVVIRQYLDRKSRPVLTENYVTGTITLTAGNAKEQCFKSRAAFIADYLCRDGLSDEQLLFNSLSTPFFAADLLKERGMDIQPTLFWHEEIRAGIPGNMKLILSEHKAGSRPIFVLKDSSVQALEKAGTDPEKYRRLGYVYPFFRENQGRKEVLIMTNSDRVENIRPIAESLPEMRFHIAAVTAMSEKLLSLSELNNVSLYPNIRYSKTEKLFEECDFYLDINHGKEILNSLQRAFLNNMLLMGFQETLHNPGYVSEENVFSAAEYTKLTEELRTLTNADGEQLLKNRLERQRSHAHAETPERFREVLGWD